MNQLCRLFGFAPVPTRIIRVYYREKIQSKERAAWRVFETGDDVVLGYVRYETVQRPSTEDA